MKVYCAVCMTLAWRVVLSPGLMRRKSLLPMRLYSRRADGEAGFEGKH